MADMTAVVFLSPHRITVVLIHVPGISFIKEITDANDSVLQNFSDLI